MTGMKIINNKTRKKGITKRTKQLIFYLSIVILPTIQFLIFYVGVNFNSLLLSFKSYDYHTGIYTWNGFNNFRKVIYDLQNVTYMKSAVRNSFTIFWVGLLICTPLSLMFAYYLYKKLIGSKIYKIVIFIPTMLSSLIVVLVFKYFVDRAIPFVVDSLFEIEINGLLTDTKSAFNTLIFFMIWTSFGTSTLLYLGAMNSISDSIIEAGEMDGMNSLQEFWYIILPSIFPTLSIFLMTSIIGFFTNQLSLFSVFGKDAEYELYTLGYYMYRSMKVATISDYPYLAALGIIMTVIAIPLTFLLRYCLKKFGPKVD